MNLKENIEAAQRSIQQIKRAAPWLLIEHAALMEARTALRLARKRYDKALRAWNALGVPSEGKTHGTS